MLRIYLVLIGLPISEQKMFYVYSNIHVCPVEGSDEPLGSNVFQNYIIFSQIAHFLQDFALT